MYGTGILKGSSAAIPVRRVGQEVGATTAIPGFVGQPALSLLFAGMLPLPTAGSEPCAREERWHGGWGGANGAYHCQLLDRGGPEGRF